MSLVNLTYVGKKKMFGDRVYACYTGDQGVYVTQYVESLDKDLRVIKDDYSALYESIDLYHMEKNPDETITRLKKMIESVEKFKAERVNIDSIVVKG